MRKWFSLIGLGFAIAGADKLLGTRGYERLFADWGWSDDARHAVGAAEFTGGVMISSRSWRHLGAWLLATTSAAMLSAEMKRGERDLALPRFILLLAAVSGLLPFSSRE